MNELMLVVFTFIYVFAWLAWAGIVFALYTVFKDFSKLLAIFFSGAVGGMLLILLIGGGKELWKSMAYLFV